MEGKRGAAEEDPIGALAAGAHADDKRGPVGGKDTAGGTPERETYGPLDIERHRKDDGRALILYTIAKRGKE
jgi:hypothetical protein